MPSELFTAVVPQISGHSPFTCNWMLRHWSSLSDQISESPESAGAVLRDFRKESPRGLPRLKDNQGEDVSAASYASRFMLVIHASYF
jgi:hypothetical protein